MSQENTAFAIAVREALEGHARGGISDRVDLWPRLQQRAINQRYREHRQQGSIGLTRRLFLVMAIGLTVSLGGVSVAAAASPALRALLHDTLPFIPSGQSSITMDVNGRPIQLQPSPPFHVFYPSSVPAALYVFGTGQMLGTGQDGLDSLGGGATCPANIHICPSLKNVHLLTLFVPPDGSSGLPTLLTPFQGHEVRVVWFGRHAVPPDNRFIQIAEWDAKTASLSTAASSLVPQPSWIQRDTMLTVTRDGATIEVMTNMGHLMTQQVVDSLQLTSLGAH